MIGSKDESLRESIWSTDHRIVICFEHLKDWINNPNVINMHRLRFNVECSIHYCLNQSIIEVELKK
jgi:hypothetical protein